MSQEEWTKLRESVPLCAEAFIVFRSGHNEITAVSKLFSCCLISHCGKTQIAVFRFHCSSVMRTRQTVIYTCSACLVNTHTYTHTIHTYLYIHTECPRRNGQNFGRVFLMLNYADITQNTYTQSWTVTEIMAIEKCGPLGCPRTVSCPWRHTHSLRMLGNEKPLANIGMQ